MGFFTEKMNKSRVERIRNEIVDCGDFLVAKATPLYIATVMKDALARKISKLSIDTAVTHRDTELLSDYEVIKKTMDDVFESLLFLRDREKAARAAELELSDVYDDNDSLSDKQIEGLDDDEVEPTN